MQRYGDPLQDVEDGKGTRDNILDSLMSELLELEGVGRSDAANLRYRIETAHTSVATARVKLTKSETALARASGELGAAKQAKVTVAKAARDTISAIQPAGAMSRGASSPIRKRQEDGALALQRTNFRSVSAPLAAAASESVSEGEATSELVEPEIEPPPEPTSRATTRAASEPVSEESSVSSERVPLPRRPQRPPPTPPPTMLVPFPSPVTEPTDSARSSPSSTVSGLAVMVEDFLFGRDLDSRSDVATGKKGRSDSFNSSLKLPSLSFSLESPLQTIAYAVGYHSHTDTLIYTPSHI